MIAIGVCGFVQPANASIQVYLLDSNGMPFLSASQYVLQTFYVYDALGLVGTIDSSGALYNADNVVIGWIVQTGPE